MECMVHYEKEAMLCCSGDLQHVCICMHGHNMRNCLLRLNMTFFNTSLADASLSYVQCNPILEGTLQTLFVVADIVCGRHLVVDSTGHSFLQL